MKTLNSGRMQAVKIAAKGLESVADYVSLSRRYEEETVYSYNTTTKVYDIKTRSSRGSKIYGGKGLTSRWGSSPTINYDELKKDIDLVVDGVSKDASGADHHQEKYHKILPWSGKRDYTFAPKRKPEEHEKQIREKLKEVASALVAENPGLELSFAYSAEKHMRKFDDSSENHFDEKKILSTVLAKAKYTTRIGEGPARQTIVTEGYDAVSDTKGAELLFDNAERVAKRAAQRAIENSKVKEMPQKTDRILMGGQLTGVFIHEMVGHGAEADIVMEGSPLGKLYKKKVAIDAVTIKDVPESEFGRGNMKFDDEGTPCRDVSIINNGIVSDFMTDRATTVQMLKKGYEVTPSGNGRSANHYASIMPRMRNTVMAPGEKTHEELVKELDNGLYVIGTSGGSVYTNGDFTLNTSLAYWVENGEIKFPVKTSSIKGNTVNVLGHILSVGNAATNDSFAGYCGKNWQYVAVSAIGPEVLVDSLGVSKYAEQFDDYGWMIKSKGRGNKNKTALKLDRA